MERICLYKEMERIFLYKENVQQFLRELPQEERDHFLAFVESQEKYSLKFFRELISYYLVHWFCCSHNFNKTARNVFFSLQSLGASYFSPLVSNEDNSRIRHEYAARFFEVCKELLKEEAQI